MDEQHATIEQHLERALSYAQNARAQGDPKGLYATRIEDDLRQALALLRVPEPALWAAPVDEESPGELLMAGVS
jgi:hypothetical protein